MIPTFLYRVLICSRSLYREPQPVVLRNLVVLLCLCGRVTFVQWSDPCCFWSLASVSFVDQIGTVDGCNVAVQIDARSRWAIVRL